VICVSVANRKGLQEAIQSGAGIIELRLDLFREPPSELLPLVPGHLETIITCRPGVYSERECTDLLTAGIKLGANYVNLEIETPAGQMEILNRTARQAGATIIVSYHDFKRTADREDLESIMIACYEKGGEIAKIATMVNAPDDVRNLLALYDLPGKKVIIGMGPKGRITRVMGPYLGAVFTYASVGKGGETAPGQLTVNQLNEIYKVIDKA